MEFKFKNGDKMPAVALGTWRLWASEIEGSVNAALDNGYEGIDTAQVYTNEMHIGKAINGRKTFLTSKLDLRNFKGAYEESIKESLGRLRVEQLDLFLLHWPVEDYELVVKVYGQIIELRDKGYTKHIGVSNANIKVLNMIHDKYGEWPEVNQFKYSLIDQRKDLRAFCEEKGIIVTGYQTLAVWFEHDSLTSEQKAYISELAKKYGKSEANIIARQSLQSNMTILPKSKTPSRVIENIEVLDFELSNEEMKEFSTWDKNITTEENIVNDYKELKSWMDSGDDYLYGVEYQPEIDMELKNK